MYGLLVPCQELLEQSEKAKKNLSYQVHLYIKEFPLFLKSVNLSISAEVSLVLMAERSRAYVYDCSGVTKTSSCSNLLATYAKERLLPSMYKKHSNRVLWVIEFVS